ncbi:hypothetical protein BH10BAC5_BH10BAC5_27250 [soil metagenome]
MFSQHKIDSAFKKCEHIAKTHYENFPVGSLLIPKAKRKYVYAIYAFARYADDIADSNEEGTVKYDKLQRFEMELLKTEKLINSDISPVKEFEDILSNVNKSTSFSYDEEAELLKSPGKAEEIISKDEKPSFDNGEEHGLPVLEQSKQLSNGKSGLPVQEMGISDKAGTDIPNPEAPVKTIGKNAGIEIENLNQDTSYIFISLSCTIKDLEIPVKEFFDLLIAFKQDCIVSRYASFEQLIEYSAYSADPIGHLILYLFGYKPEKDQELFELSGKICTGLQLINFWQDVMLDLKINRVYIPNNLIVQFGYTFSELERGIENESFVKVMKELVKLTREVFEKGKPLIGKLHGRLRLEIKATYLGGQAILNKIEEIEYKVLSKRVKLSKKDKLKILFKAFP